MTAGQTIDYETLARAALRGVVREVLLEVARSGLPGDHHFYISFDTEAPGVALSKRLREKYAGEMMIVMQHRFWDLGVTADRFEVKLTFDGITERLVIPFAALKAFFDPSVRYGLQFEERVIPAVSRQLPVEESEEPPLAEDHGPPRPAFRPAGPRKPRIVRRPRVETNGESRTEPSVSPSRGTVSTPLTSATAPPADRESSDEGAPATDGEPAGGAEIVRLDAFRRK